MFPKPKVVGEPSLPEPVSLPGACPGRARAAHGLADGRRASLGFSRRFRRRSCVPGQRFVRRKKKKRQVPLNHRVAPARKPGVHRESTARSRSNRRRQRDKNRSASPGEQVQYSSSTHTRTRPSQVPAQLGIGAARVLQGIGDQRRAGSGELRFPEEPLPLLAWGPPEEVSKVRTRFGGP